MVCEVTVGFYGQPRKPRPDYPGGAVHVRRRLASDPDAAAAVATHRPVDQQGDDGTDDGAQQTGRLQEATLGVVVEQGVTQEAPDERADDAEQDRGPDAH